MGAQSSPSSVQLDTDAETQVFSLLRELEVHQQLSEVPTDVSRMLFKIVERKVSNSIASGLVVQLIARMSTMEREVASMELKALLTNESMQTKTTAM